MIFEIHAERNSEDKKIFYYDNVENILKSEDGIVFEYDPLPDYTLELSIPFDKDHPIKKSKKINVLKIQMGLSCNYSCDYCSQKFVERAPETNKKDIDAFLEKLDVLEFGENLKVEFWGGEPLVYWKTMKPLAEALSEKLKEQGVKYNFSIITNGSILTDEMIDWLMMMDFGISISHDGPGQSVRGPDPFDDPEQKDRILGLYRMMTRLKKSFSFNAMLNSKNQSRKAIYDWFVNLTGDENVQIGEGGIVDAYDEDGAVNSLQTLQDHFQFRRTALSEMIATEGHMGFTGQIMKIGGFIDSVLAHKHSKYLGQKCGMDHEGSMAVDLRGNVITCQNVSAAETSMNGMSHNGGNLSDFDNIELKSVTHWSNRKECSDCPVLHVCKGACMFLQEKYWDVSCANAYSDNIVHFALGIMQITNGYIPTLIKSENLPLERQDLWGTLFEHKEKSKRKIIPIKVISEKVATIDGIDVYGKSHINSN